MRIQEIFKISALASAIILGGCGGDIEIQPTVNDNSVNNSNNTSTTAPDVSGDENLCASYGEGSDLKQGSMTADGDCSYGLTFASKSIEITEDLSLASLPNGGVHIFESALQMGEDCDTTTSCTIDTDGPTLTVEAGATVAFRSGEALIRIGRGANIDAVGTIDAPITFTATTAISRLDVVGKGPSPFGDWAGIVINGLGITDQCTDAERDGATCNAESEGDGSFYGGNDNTDNSGMIKFAKINYAGSGPIDGGDGNDFNSLLLNSVGSDTEIDYIHIHQGYDDGIEFFGGAVDIKHIVVTENQDDAIDIDAGWQGKGQYIFITHGDAEYDGVMSPMGNHGFETDGKKGTTSTQAPVSTTQLANITFIGSDQASVRDGDPSRAVKFDDGIQATYYNALFVKPTLVQIPVLDSDGNPTGSFEDDGCVVFSGDGQINASANSFNNTVLACAQDFVAGDTAVFDDADTDSPGQTRAQWLALGTDVDSIGAITTLQADGIRADSASFSASPAASLPAGMEAAAFIGAVDYTDTSSDWYNWVNTALTLAAND